MRNDGESFGRRMGFLSGVNKVCEKNKIFLDGYTLHGSINLILKQLLTTLSMKNYSISDKCDKYFVKFNNETLTLYLTDENINDIKKLNSTVEFDKL